MAKAQTLDSASVAREIINNIDNGIFAPVYLLMGEEPYYVDMVAKHITEKALEEDQRDFNQLISYGADVTVDDVVGNARRYPVFADRQLVVVREAQQLSGIENLAAYTDNPLDSTVFVLVYRGSLDKRKALYKSIAKNGVILESNPVRDYEMSRWISSFYASRGLQIEPEAAELLAESAGTDLGKIAVETDKMLKNLPEGTKNITVKDIEENVGVSREFSIFELTRQLSYKQADKALRIAYYMGQTDKFAMPAVTAPLFNHFDRILKYEALAQKGPVSPEDKQRVLGVSPYFFREYDAAVRNYPLRKTMAIISLICEYDFKGKGGEAGQPSQSQMFIELVTKILSM